MEWEGFFDDFMKVQIKRKEVREGKMDKKGEKGAGEGGATLLLECLWFYNTNGPGGQKGEEGEGINRQLSGPLYPVLST